MSVSKVTHERWLEAQRQELALWSEWRQGRGWRRLIWRFARPLLGRLGFDFGAGDDWNRWWADQFDNYRFLPDDLRDYIELGCGPYTNTRLILRGRRANRIVCSDPLAGHYVKFRGRWLADAYKKGRVEIDEHPIEELPFEAESFDVVVLINVLDHVRSADACLTNATALVRRDGYFLFGQDLVPQTAGDDDVLHPIKLSAADVESYLESFAPIVQKLLPSEHARSPTHEGTLVFAGRKTR
jgi:SAM-dependent methyltransferase